MQVFTQKDSKNINESVSIIIKGDSLERHPLF